MIDVDGLRRVNREHGAGAGSEVLRLCGVFRARVVDLSPATLTVEITGTPDKVDALVEVLRPYGIAEMVRTGPLAMGRGAEVNNEVKVAAGIAA